MLDQIIVALKCIFFRTDKFSVLFWLQQSGTFVIFCLRAIHHNLSFILDIFYSIIYTVLPSKVELKNEYTVSKVYDIITIFKIYGQKV